jgi:hypothetical protein
LPDHLPGEPVFSPYQALNDAAAQDRIKQLTKGIAVTKAAMPILGKAGMIRHLVFQAKPAEPPISQIGADFFTQTPFGADAVTVRW